MKLHATFLKHEGFWNGLLEWKTFSTRCATRGAEQRLFLITKREAGKAYEKGKKWFVTMGILVASESFRNRHT
eukprot:1140095-Pelagomonas_calceolata.AAC.3